MHPDTPEAPPETPEAPEVSDILQSEEPDSAPAQVQEQAQEPAQAPAQEQVQEQAQEIPHELAQELPQNLAQNLAQEPEPALISPEEQLAAVNDQLLRALAEIENTRRRGERQHSEALKYGIMGFARDMLGVADNLHRALANAPAPENAPDDTPDDKGIKAVLDGIAATERDLQAILQRHKIMPINPLGEKFDPNLHEALFEAPIADTPNGTIIEVVELGYMLDDRLLRPAKVGIAKA